MTEMNTLFWASTLCLFSFVAGFCLYAWFDFNRRKKELPQKTSSSFSTEGTGVPSDASLRDSVTQFYNRKHLINRLKENIARCDRTGEKMAIILWDIDGFVEFNNQFGQKEGDKLLRKVAETILKTVRAYDENFRTGADEFCALLLPADDVVASDVTARVSQTISRNLFEAGTEYADRRFSISTGLVFYPGTEKLPESILYAASQALYRSRKEKMART